MIYVLLSALLFVAGFIVPWFSIVGMTTFLIPIVYKANFLSFWYGFFWGLIVFGIHWFWLLVLFVTKNTGLFGYLFWGLIVCWCSILSGIWFYFFKKIPFISTVIFLIVISKYWMLVDGILEGYPLCNIIVPLVDNFLFLNLLSISSELVIIVFLVGSQIYMLWYQIIFFWCIVFGGINFLYKDHLSDKPNFIVIRPWWYSCKDPMFAGYRMSHDICVASSRNNTAEMIVMPESTFCWDLNEFELFQGVWSDSANNIPILLGAYSFQDGYAYNSCFVIHENKIVYKYRKQHLMPIVERLTPIELLLKKSFLKIDYSVMQPCNKNKTFCGDDLIVVSGTTYQVFICSELFFEAKKVKGYPIILIWNDTWLMCAYAKRLAVLFIKYFAKKHKVVVWHVSTHGYTNL